MKKILSSVLAIGVVAVMVLAVTNAFFSDTETSTGNLFVAGDIDLRISNESYATDCTIPDLDGECTGELVASQSNTWESNDLTDQLFFNFTDLKPGDFGEDTIDIVVGSNDAWACMAIDMTATPENGIVDPEADAGDETDGDDGGELQNYLEFAFWVDDGDNVFEDDEEVAWTGRANEMFDGNWQRLADSTGGFFGENPLPGDETVYVAKAWCFGELTQNPVATDNGDQEETPLTAGTGFTCNGAGDGDQNDAQTDSIEADISFYAVQARNNDEFLCSSLPQFEGGDGEEEPRPTIDGVSTGGEWDDCTEIDLEDGKGTACVLAYTDYMYVLYNIEDPTDDREGENTHGNDQLGLNINPTDDGPFGKPYDIVFQTGTDPAAFTTPTGDSTDDSSGPIDGWETEWVEGDSQEDLPADVEVETPTYTDGPRVSEWKLPLSSIAGLSSGDVLKVGGAADIGDDSSYNYPPTLDWSDPFGTFVDITVN